MTDLKISQLTDGGGLSADDELAVNRGGNSKKARGIGTDGWINDTSETWTYASGSGGGVATFTVTGDLRTKYTVGTRIKLTQTTVKYFVVSADPTYNAGTNTTTVTILAGSDYTLANASISANYHSYSANPQGYPTWFNFTPTLANGWSSTTVNKGKFNLTGRSCVLLIRISGTSNATTTNVTLPITWANVVTAFLAPALVTDNGATIQGRYVFTTATNLRFDASLTAADGWTASGTKVVQVALTYDI